MRREYGRKSQATENVMFDCPFCQLGPRHTDMRSLINHVCRPTRPTGKQKTISLKCDHVFPKEDPNGISAVLKCAMRNRFSDLVVIN